MSADPAGIRIIGPSDGETLHRPKGHDRFIVPGGGFALLAHALAPRVLGGRCTVARARMSTATSLGPLGRDPPRSRASSRLAGSRRTGDASSTSVNVDHINAVLQARLVHERVDEVPAVEAARWLDAAGVLKDSETRPGLPLRNLLRAGRIDNAVQRPAKPHGRWYITRGCQVAADDGGRDVSAVGPRRVRMRTKAPRSTGDQPSRARRRRDRAARKYGAPRVIGGYGRRRFPLGAAV